MSDRKMGNIGTAKPSNLVTAHGIFNIIKNVENGNTDIMINNSPIVSLRHEDLRKILMFAIQNNGSDMETFNEAMSMVDELKVKHI